jgi:hypothetical protein
MVKSVMHAPATDEEAKEFDAIDRENRLLEEENEREIAAAKGELTQSEFDPFAGTDKRDGRVLQSEIDSRHRHRDYDSVVDPVVALIHRSPEVFTVLRDSAVPGEAAYALGQILQNPALADHQKYKDFIEYLRNVASRKTGKFEGLTPEAFTELLEAYKNYADDDEDVNSFFDRK